MSSAALKYTMLNRIDDAICDWFVDRPIRGIVSVYAIVIPAEFIITAVVNHFNLGG